jgi:hypothetical protein
MALAAHKRLGDAICAWNWLYWWREAIDPSI